jgi:hypothetical protein
MQLDSGFEDLFLAAFEKHLPSLVPLLSTSSGKQPVETPSQNRKRSRDEELEESSISKRVRREEDDTVLNVEKAISHLETEFLYNPHPTEKRKVALSVFTGLDIYAIDNWFEKKNSIVAVKEPRKPMGSGLGERLQQVEQVAVEENKTTGFLEQGWLKHLRESAKRANPTNDVDPQGKVQESVAKHRSAMALNMDVEKPFSCTKDGCSMKFKFKSDWKRHEEAHYPQVGFVCHLSAECKTKIFPRKDKFQEHLKKYHEDKAESVSVKDCERPITNDATFQCPICSRRFPSWTERCDHIAKMAEEGRRALMKQRIILRVRTDNKNNSQDLERQQNQQRLAEQELPANPDEHDASTDQNSVAKLGLPQSRGDDSDMPQEYSSLGKYLELYSFLGQRPWISLLS